MVTATMSSEVLPGAKGDPVLDPWEGATAQEWNDWRWQFRNRLISLQSILPLLPAEVRQWASGDAANDLPFAATPHFTRLIASTPDVPELARLVIPTQEELLPFEGQLEDPTGEEEVTPAPGLRHMYPDRVLYTLTYICPCYCRHCFRRRIVGTAAGLSYPQIELGLRYIHDNPQIREVILSGGEPLLLSDSKLRRILTDLRSIPSVEVVRIHTRCLSFMPQRITRSLVSNLKAFCPLYINVSVAHPAELSPETFAAFSLLADNGFPLGSQTPLLRGINDSPEVMRRLMLTLLKNRVRPYYIHNCIPAKGAGGFRVPVEQGIEIIHSLRGHITGLAVPTFSVFLSESGGKVSLEPDYLVRRMDGQLVFRNYKGDLFQYPNAH